MNNFFRIAGGASLLCTLALTVACSGDDVRDLPDTVVAARHLTDSTVDVRSFDVYTDGEVMHLFSAESRPPAKTVRLYHRSSADEGASWSPPVQVNDAAHPPHKPHRGNDIQIAAAGNSLVAAWTTAGTGFMGSGPLATAVSKDGGQTWQPGANPGDKNNTAGHGFADIIAHRDGFDMVWLDSRMDKQGLRHARSSDGGVSWSDNVTLDAKTCECCWNSLARAADGNLYALYRGLTPRDMLLTSSHDGENWKQLGPVGKFDWKIDACPHNGGGLALWPGQTNTLHAAV